MRDAGVINLFLVEMLKSLGIKFPQWHQLLLEIWFHIKNLSDESFIVWTWWNVCVSNVNFVLISNGQQLHHLLVCLLFAICLGVTWDHEQQLKIAGICIFHFIYFFQLPWYLCSNYYYLVWGILYSKVCKTFWFANLFLRLPKLKKSMKIAKILQVKISGMKVCGKV